jgi:hypothetical protein
LKSLGHAATTIAGVELLHRIGKNQFALGRLRVRGNGFGHSDRYPEMDVLADANPPLCLAEDAAAQLAVAVRFILEHQG